MVASTMVPPRIMSAAFLKLFRDVIEDGFSKVMFLRQMTELQQRGGIWNLLSPEKLILTRFHMA